MTIDHRTKAMIEVKKIGIGVLTLRYNNLELKLSHVEAERIGELLRKVTAVQRDRKGISNMKNYINWEDEDD